MQTIPSLTHAPIVVRVTSAGRHYQVAGACCNRNIVYHRDTFPKQASTQSVSIANGAFVIEYKLFVCVASSLDSKHVPFRKVDGATTLMMMWQALKSLQIRNVWVEIYLRYLHWNKKGFKCIRPILPN